MKQMEEIGDSRHSSSMNDVKMKIINVNNNPNLFYLSWQLSMFLLILTLKIIKTPPSFNYFIFEGSKTWNKWLKWNKWRWNNSRCEQLIMCFIPFHIKCFTPFWQIDYQDVWKARFLAWLFNQNNKIENTVCNIPQ